MVQFNFLPFTVNFMNATAILALPIYNHVSTIGQHARIVNEKRRPQAEAWNEYNDVNKSLV
jgi:hypothetical protein